MKKIRKITVLSMLILILISLLGKSTYAAMEVKALGDGETVKTNIAVTYAFAYCYNLRASGTTLGNNTLDPHLTLNSDWGAVAYLAASVYGTNGTSTDTIISSTTGNESGVKDMGKTLTFTSSILGTAVDSSNYSNIFNNKNTKYVEVLATTKSDTSNIGKAMYETDQWSGNYPTYNSSYGYATYPTTSTSSDYIWSNGKKVPINIRYKIFSTIAGSLVNTVTYYTFGSGEARGDVTFRPVIWN